MLRVLRTGLRPLKFVPDKFLRGAGLRMGLVISRVLSWTIIHLGCMSPYTSSDLPESQCGPRWLSQLDSYLVLLQVGFSLPFLLPIVRCALTAPFHPYLPTILVNRRYIFCGTFRRLTPPRRYLALCPVEPGLSS